MSIKGNQLTSLQRVEGYPRYTQDGRTETLEDRFICQWGLVNSLAPSLGAFTQWLPGARLQSRTIEREGDAGIISCIYRFPDSDEPVIDDVETYQSRASVNEDGEYTVQWQRKMRESSFPLTQANITKNIGTKVAPPGMQSPQNGEWLKLSREIYNGPEYTEIVDTYEWKDGGWGSDYAFGTDE